MNNIGIFVFLSAAVQSSMPSFHAKMQSRLRTEAMGADTVVWLAASQAATKQPSGLFFQGEKPSTFSQFQKRENQIIISWYNNNNNNNGRMYFFFPRSQSRSDTPPSGVLQVHSSGGREARSIIGGARTQVQTLTFLQVS